MTSKEENHTCPYCKEEIKVDAVKCKHCHSLLASTSPSHGGTCPYCKEEIQPEAIKCKHCKSSLSFNTKTGCGCENSQENEVSTALRQLRIGNFPISGRDLKCALEYLDCLDGPLSQGVCQMLQDLCRADLGNLGANLGVFARK